jgi:hypothetical protein
VCPHIHGSGYCIDGGIMNGRLEMSLPVSVEPYFMAWIRVDTWHTKHLSDMVRFYKFVWAVHRFCRARKGAKWSKKRLPKDTEIRTSIIESRRNSFNLEALEEEANFFSSLYSHLLDYANTPNNADHIIEKKNILNYYFQLENELGGSNARPEEVAIYMKRDWGDDWEERLEMEKRRYN